MTHLTYLTVVFLLATTVVLSNAQQMMTFPEYLDQFDKSYPDEAEYNRRHDLFNRTSQFIRQCNANSNKSSTCRHNRFSDMTKEEREGLLNARSDSFVGVPTKVKVPQTNLKVGAAISVDWRLSGRVSPVKDQGNCGSCWVFSSAAYIESVLAILNNTIYDISEEFLLECSNKRSTCEGGYVDDALSVARGSSGIPLESSFPYQASAVQSGKPSLSPGICSSTSGNVKLPSNITVGISYSLGDAQMKSMLQKSPVVALIYAEDNFLYYSSGVYSCSANLNKSAINHAVQVIGYTQEGNYIIKNSWGTTWGDAGFAIINKDNACNLKGFVYKYWIPSLDNPIGASKYQSLVQSYLLLLIVVLSVFWL